MLGRVPDALGTCCALGWYGLVTSRGWRRMNRHGSAPPCLEPEFEARIFDRSFLRELPAGPVEAEGCFDVSEPLLNFGMVCEALGAQGSKRGASIDVELHVLDVIVWDEREESFAFALEPRPPGGSVEVERTS